MKVWMVRFEYTSDCDTIIDERLFSDYKKAKECFDVCVAYEKANDHLMGRDELVMEENEQYFAIWEDGQYCEDHRIIEIIEKEVY